MKVILKTLLLLLVLSIPASAQDIADPQRAAAEFIISAYNAKDYASISGKPDPESAKQLTPDVLQRFLGNRFSQYGNAIKLGDEQVINGSTSTFPLTFEKGEFKFLIAVDEKGQVLGLKLIPVAPKTFKIKGDFVDSENQRSIPDSPNTN